MKKSQTLEKKVKTLKQSQTHLLKFKRTFSSKCSSVTLHLLGVRISPAQLNRRSTEALLGRVVFVFKYSAFTLGNFWRVVTGPNGSRRQELTSGMSAWASKMKNSSSTLSFAACMEVGFCWSISVMKEPLAFSRSWTSPVHVSFRLKHCQAHENANNV